MSRIGGARLAHALHVPRRWRLPNLDAAAVEPVMLLLRDNARLSTVEMVGIGNEAALGFANTLQTHARFYDGLNFNLLRSQLSVDAAMTLQRVSKATRLSVCGIAPEQRHVDLRNMNLQPVDGVLLAADVAFRSSLASLCLAENALGPEGTRAIAPSIGENVRAHGALRMLDLSCNGIGPDGARAIAAVLRKHPQSLTSLDLSENELAGIDKNGKGTYDIGAIQALMDAVVHSTSLADLNLAENQLCGISALGVGTATPGGMGAIADALCQKSELTRLSLRGNRLNNACSLQLTNGLRRAPSLTSISLCGCNLSSTAGKAITDALQQNMGITFVATANNKLGPASRFISEAMSHNSTRCMKDADMRQVLEGHFRKNGLEILSLPVPTRIAPPSSRAATPPGSSLPSIKGASAPPGGARFFAGAGRADAASASLKDPSSVQLPSPSKQAAAVEIVDLGGGGGFMTELPPPQ